MGALCCFANLFRSGVLAKAASFPAVDGLRRSLTARVSTKTPNNKKSDVKIILLLIAMAMAAGGAYHTYSARNDYIDAALLSEAFTLTSPLKLRVADYFLQNGSMPHSNDDAGLSAPNSIFGTSVKRVAINRGGVLRVDFDEEIGKTSMLFTPSAGANSGFLSWRCTSDSIDPAILEKLRPTCNYLPLTKESQLMNAIANGSMEKIEQLLNDGADLNAVVNGNTALMLAAKLGDADIINRLIDENADIDHLGVNADRRTPLMVAITSNRSEAVATLLSRGASVARTDYQGKSAMDHALDTDARLGGERYVLMVSAKLNPNFAGQSHNVKTTRSSVDEDKRLRALYGELRSVAHECNATRLRSLLSNENEMPTDGMVAGAPLKSHVSKPECSVTLMQFVQSTNVYKRALHARLSNAMRHCVDDDVRSMLSDNPEVDVLNREARGVPLFEEAAFAGCANLVATLIRDKSLKGKIDDRLLTDVIDRAPQDTLVRMIGSLIEAGVDVNAKSRAGETALATSIAAEQPVVAKYLVDAGAELNVQTTSGSYPLIEATKKGYSHLVSQLIAGGAELNVSDQFGRSAIIAAVAQSKVRLVDLLLRAGVNPHLRDNNGISALILAERQGNRAIQSLITSSASND